MSDLERMVAGQDAVLERASRHARAFVAGLDTMPAGATAPVAALRAALHRPLPDGPRDDVAVIDDLVRGVEGGLQGSPTGRFFGWVIGGTLPVAIAADWLTSAWDQNAASHTLAPAAAVVEEICGVWLKDLLGLPPGASFGLVTGCQMAHATALAAARHRLLADRGIDVERVGLAGTPPIRVLTGEHRHESIIRAVRLLGLGSDCVRLLPCRTDGPLDLGALEAALAEGSQPTIVCLQAGDLNTGAYDPFGPACALAHAARAWVHVDGAFGLWAAANPRTRHWLDGAAAADSWATDGHKWLNLPHDSGFVFVADPAAHQAAFGQAASYSVLVDGTRRQIDWNPEWSRRGRGFALYAALGALGRAGVADLVQRGCAMAAALVEELGRLPDVEILARPRINQGLVRFLDPAGRHDERTDAVVSEIQRTGLAWFGATTWRGLRAMRVSVCNWRTGEADVRTAVEAVGQALRTVSSA
jgi:glutamate/tyrosine decarboxylase-like PLP-dependent enzyme